MSRCVRKDQQKNTGTSSPHMKVQSPRRTDSGPHQCFHGIPITRGVCMACIVCRVENGGFKWDHEQLFLATCVGEGGG